MKSSTEPEEGIYGLLGHGISYSLSPSIHNHIFTSFGIKAVYGLFDLKPEDFHNSIGALVRHASGLNVTVPYKEKVIPYLDALSAEAKLTGSVNLISRGIGYNSDYLALRDLLSSMYGKLEGKDCVVFGAGGAARTAAFLLGENEASVRILNRTAERAERLERDLLDAGFSAEAVVIDPDLRRDIFRADVVVNCISSPEFEFPRMIADLAVDFNYGARSENFRSKMETGSILISGEKILIGQAIYSQKIWNGIEPSFDELMGVINVK